MVVPIIVGAQSVALILGISAMVTSHSSTISTKTGAVGKTALFTVIFCIADVEFPFPSLKVQFIE